MRTIGIDLGTTNCLAAVWENGESRLIPNSYGEYLTPSVVCVDSNNQVYVGKVAQEKLITHPTQCARFFKCFMGTKKEFVLGSRTFQPEELSALLLKRIKEDAESYLGEEVEEAIISVPAYFNDLARNATKRAGELAGFVVKRIINEPSAAALACQNLSMEEDATVLVFDFGGGTLDVSLVECFDNIVQIVAVSGDNHLGGRDFDDALAAYFCREQNIDWEHESADIRNVILKSAEQCKRELSEKEEAAMQVRFQEHFWEMTIDRNTLVKLSAEIFKKMEIPVHRVLADSRLSAEELTDIVLVGGSCKMKVVQQYLSYIMEGREVQTREPDTMIALGLGACVGIKERKGDIKDMLLTDICPFSLGTGIINPAGENEKTIMSVIIERNSPLPTSHEQSYVTVHDNQTKLCMKIYQGENYYAEDNLCLGELSLRIPPKKKGQIKVQLRYTYDINGILEVQAHVPFTGKTEHLVIIQNGNKISEAEKEQKLREFERLKIHPKQKEENAYLMAKGEALFTQANGQLKDFIGYWLGCFEKLLDSQNEPLIQKHRKDVEQAFSQAEDLLNCLPRGVNPYTEDWYKRDPGQAVVEDFEMWRQKKK